MRSFLDDSIAEHNSRPPLRWIANWAGSIASKNMLQLSYMQDEGLDKGFRYKYYGWLWDTFWPIYHKYGTFYRFSMDLSGKAWDDYDDNGTAYWEASLEWDYYDEETGEALRIINRKE